MVVISVIIGLALLFLGRKLFWFFVGAAGFIIGFTYGPQIFQVESRVVILVIALLAGILGALIAIFLKGVAIAIGGFIAGGYIAVEVLRFLDIAVGPEPWLIYLAGGILGAVLLLLIFNWALIVLSSLLGASVIIENVTLRPSWEVLLFLVLAVIGIIVQTAWLRSEKRAEY